MSAHCGPHAARTLALEISWCHPGVTGEQLEVQEALHCPGPVANEGAELRVGPSPEARSVLATPVLCSSSACLEGLRDPICLLEELLVTFPKILKPFPLFADTLFQLKVCVAWPFAPTLSCWLGDGDSGVNCTQRDRL